MRKSLVSPSVLAVAGILSHLSLAHAAGLSGAIFTTISTGTVVNANQYNSKCEVYLNGGPGAHGNPGAAGLPDDSYYFQVTDPNGHTLLSTDPVSNRQFTVSGGAITAYTGTGGPPHLTGTSPSAGAITIALANETCGTTATPADFLDSPNQGGVYKVWVTSTSSYNPNCGNGCSFGFAASASKTDNFKVVPGIPNFCLTVSKQIVTSVDSSGNITSTPGANWGMTVTDSISGAVIGPLPTDSTGTVQFCSLPASTYMVSETPNSLYPFFEATLTIGTMQSLVKPPSAATVSFTWQAGDSSPSVVFYNSAPLS